MHGRRLSDKLALRIGLAARVLPGIDARQLLQLLIDVLGEPLTATKLERLRISGLRKAAKQEFEKINDTTLSEAVAYLKGRGVIMLPDELPEVADYQEGDMPGSIRVACASDHGDAVDAAFSTCLRFLIYQVSAIETRLIDIREVGNIPATKDRNIIRSELLADCHVLYTTTIGGPAAAKVIRTGALPIKLSAPAHTLNVLRQLQDVLSDAPPPWLAKAMGVTSPHQTRFREERLP